MKNTIKKPHGNKYIVHPHQNGWAVDCEQKSKVSYAYKQKDKAVGTAKFLARKNRAAAEIIEPDGSTHELI